MSLLTAMKVARAIIQDQQLRCVSKAVINYSGTQMCPGWQFHMLTLPNIGRILRKWHIRYEKVDQACHVHFKITQLSEGNKLCCTNFRISSSCASAPLSPSCARSQIASASSIRFSTYTKHTAYLPFANTRSASMSGLEASEQVSDKANSWNHYTS